MSNRGIPLLSGPPPDPAPNTESSNCRRCNKEFNFVFARSKHCNHCGYSYCSSCADFQALMPRNGPEQGYDTLSVCAYCIDLLRITASSRAELRAMPLSKLKSHIKAYGISLGSAVEKDDLVDAIQLAKGEDGCLLPRYENYYRRHNVPHGTAERKTRNIFSRFSGSHDSESSLRPSQQQQQQQQQQQPPRPPPQAPFHSHPSQPQPQPQYPYSYAPPPQQPPNQQYHTQHTFQVPPQSPQPQFPHGFQSQPPPHGYPPQPHGYPPQPPGYPPQPQYQPQYQPPPHPPPTSSQPGYYSQPGPGPGPNLRPSNSHSNLRHSPGNSNASSRPSGSGSGSQARPTPPPRPRSAAPTAPTSTPAPRPPTPTLDSLITMSPEEIPHLSISTLKAILFRNRVNTSTGVLEKEDLVKKVKSLIADEKFERARKLQAEAAAREEEESMAFAREERERDAAKRREEEREREELRERFRQTHVNDPMDEDPVAASTSQPPPSPPSEPRYHDRDDGLCVVCQDEHANMAIIDCGHLALCKDCSDLIMQSSRECPLCRTRIVTEQRLLRIFKS